MCAHKNALWLCSIDCCSAARKLISHEMWCREAQEWRAKCNAKNQDFKHIRSSFYFSSISARFFYCSVYKLLLARMRRSGKLINNEQVMRLYSSLSSELVYIAKKKLKTGCSPKINLIFLNMRGDTKIEFFKAHTWRLIEQEKINEKYWASH